MSSPVVTVERTIHAEPAAIFDLLADPQKHPLIDGSGTVKKINTGPDRLSKGAEFGVAMKAGAPYKVTNTVVEFEEGRVIAWRHFAGHRWRYTLTPVAGGTRVQEQWDPTPVSKVVQTFYKVVGFPARNRKGMEASLERLDGLVTTPPV